MTLTQSDEDVIGNLKWVIYDTSRKDMISRGETFVRASDVVVEVKPAVSSKKIELGEQLDSQEWVINDAGLMDMLSRGENTSRVSDVEIGPGEIIKKKIELGDHFNLCLADRRKADRPGFGLYSERDGEGTFSWDWFVIDRPGHANKLQESGELSIEIKATEIHRMEFLTDVCIRVSRKTDANPLNPAWRIMIFEGSVISWPSSHN